MFLATGRVLKIKITCLGNISPQTRLTIRKVKIGILGWEEVGWKGSEK